jgi:hypothetical protein
MAVARPFANRHHGPLRAGSCLVVLALCLTLAMLAGCDKGSTVGASRAVGDAKSASNRTIESEALRQKGGLCDENRRVSKPEVDRPEWVIWRMYELALGPDDDKSFEAFRQLFPSTRNPRELREMFWNRLRTSVHKMTVEPGKPDFVVCRSIDTDQGRKYYIVTSDPRQSPPPITVGEVEGRNRILFLTPF